MKRIYIKTEPAGEIGLGKLSEEDIQLFKSLKNSGGMKASLFVSNPFDFCQQGAEGVFIGQEDTIEGELPKYECIETISLFKDGGRYEDGWYIVHTGLTKASIEFEFKPEEGDFDINELVIEYQEVKLSELSDELYGELNFNVLSGFLYKGDLIDEYDGELIDRGIDREVHILQIKDGEINTVYKNRNYLKEYWRP